MWINYFDKVNIRDDEHTKIILEKPLENRENDLRIRRNKNDAKLGTKEISRRVTLKNLVNNEDKTAKESNLGYGIVIIISKTYCKDFFNYLSPD